MTRYHQLSCGLILLVFTALAVAYGLVVPPFENLDEIEHFGAVRYVAETGRLPVHGTPDADVYRYRQEASQPPLYYLLSAGLVRALGLEAPDAAPFWRFNPRLACGPQAPSLFDNRTVLYHNPNLEALPWHGALLMLHLLRLWSTLLQAATVTGAYALTRRAFPQHPGAALLAMAVVAFNPQFLLVASGVNNDNLVTPLATWGLYLMLGFWQEGVSVQRSLALGALIGLAGLSKLSGWLLLPLSLAVLLALGLRSLRRNDLASLKLSLASLALLLAVPVSLAGWWFWRNWQLYRDPTGLAPMLDLVGIRESSLVSASVANLMFRSFWGQIPCSFFPSAFYAPYAMLTALSVVGLVWGRRRWAARERRAATILAGWLLLVVAAWVRWNSITPAPGGRLLFPALPAVAALMAVGVQTLGRPRIVIPAGVILLVLMASWTAAHILPAFFAPPPRWADRAAVRPSHSLNVEFGQVIRLLGYDTTPDAERSLLHVTLYWEAAAPTPEDYILALHLVSPVPGDTTLRWTYDSWPGHGTYPTSAWQPGEVIADRYRFRLPEAEFPTQAWDLQLVVYLPHSGARLPARVGGVPGGDRVILARLRLPGKEPTCPQVGQLASEVRFNDAVSLTHAWVTPADGGTQVALCWKALTRLPRDYQVFVHLYDGAGNLADAGDGPPMQGAFPTSTWEPGDVILDIHRIGSPVGEGRITVGLYLLEDGSRLPAWVEDQPVREGEVVVWPSRP